jgi:hypothetical protein
LRKRSKYASPAACITSLVFCSASGIVYQLSFEFQYAVPVALNAQFPSSLTSVSIRLTNFPLPSTLTPITYGWLLSVTIISVKAVQRYESRKTRELVILKGLVNDGGGSRDSGWSELLSIGEVLEHVLCRQGGVADCLRIEIEGCPVGEEGAFASCEGGCGEEGGEEEEEEYIPHFDKC